MTINSREQLLDAERSKYIAQGYTEIHSTRYSSVLEKKPIDISTTAHVFLTLFTLGAWIVLWFITGLANKVPTRVRIVINADGQVVVEKTAAGRTLPQEQS